MRLPRAFGLIETLIGIALMLIIFTGLLELLRASIALSSVEKVDAAAIALAQNQMEYLRGLSYDSLGTVGGIPTGNVPQMSTTTINGIDYGTRTFISYVDDPADGIGDQDANGITTDYKIAKVSVSYSTLHFAKTTSLISTFVPPSIETSTGGGTLKINVPDADGVGVSGASIHIVNASLAPAVDLSTFTNASGTVYLSGASPSSEYQVTVTKNGYSTAETYARTTTNVNPTPGYLTVAANQTADGTFAIDRLATLVLNTFSPPSPLTFSDTFIDDSKLAATSSVDVSGGVLSLDDGSSAGSARAVVFTPTSLSVWQTASATLATSSDASASIQIFDASGALLPDSVLPGNSTGFVAFPVDLSGVSTSTYPALALGVTFTSATTTEPSVRLWSITALSATTPLPDVSFTLTGTKTIGSDSSGEGIVKNIITSSTGALASGTLSLEWDAYTLSVSGYDVTDACSAPPYALPPGSTMNVALTLGAETTNSLLTSVVDSAGAVVPDASVTLTGGQSATSSSCGVAYFGGLGNSTYDVTISKAGYTPTTVTGVTVSGETYFVAAFP